MQDEIKPHVRVKLTRKMLEDKDACPEGLDAIAPHLPLTLSTDPEENIKIALVIADGDRAHEGNADAYWAAGTFAGQWGECADNASDPMPHEISNRDAYQVAQHLAMVADAIAKNEGR